MSVELQPAVAAIRGPKHARVDEVREVAPDEAALPEGFQIS